MKNIFWLTFILALLTSPVFGQEVEMADSFRSEGKIYVVVLVLTIITTGLFGYLFYLDKKISSIEKNQKQL